MNAVNAALTRSFDTLLAPLRGMPATAIVVVSVLAGVIMTAVFRYTSSQQRLRDVADEARAQLLCMRLFRDDLRVALVSQARLALAVVKRLWYSLPPVLVLAIPFLVLLTQLALRYEHRPLAVGESAVVEVRLAPDAWESCRDAPLVVPDGLRLQTPAVRDAGTHSVAWRVGVETPPTGPLRWDYDGTTVTKTLASAEDPPTLRPVSILRTSDRWQRILHPGEDALPADGPVRSIDVHHPRRTTRVLGFDVPWWVTVLVVSMATALVAGRVMRVQF